MEGCVISDSETQYVEISPNEQLIIELNALKAANITGVAVEDFGGEFIESLNECEVAMALAGVRTAPLVNQVYKEYLEAEYKDWPTFWLEHHLLARMISEIYINAADLIPDDPNYLPYKEYLQVLAGEWFRGVGRSTSEAEMLWYNLTWEHCRIDLRSSPKLEEGHEAYSKSEREDGGTASLTIRQVVRMLGSEDETEVERFVKSGILDVLGAHKIYPNIVVRSREDNVWLRSAMHGLSRATAHQYKSEREGFPMQVMYISNLNQQAKNREEFLQRLPRFFTPELAAEMKRIVSADIPEMRFGHEVAETLIESMNKPMLRKIKSREGVELLSTLVTIEGIRRQIKEPGDTCDILYDSMMKRFIAGYYDLISRPFDRKLLPYLRGDDYAMERLRKSGALIYEGKGKYKILTGINRPSFEKTVTEMVDTILSVIRRGDKDRHDNLLK